MIIQDIDLTKTFVVEFLCKSRQCWRARKQTGRGATSSNLVFIEESKEYEIEEQHFVEAQTKQKDTKEENIVANEKQLSIEV